MPSSSRLRQTAARNSAPVLADAAGEDDHVGAAQLDQVGAEVVPHVGGEHVQGQLRPGVARRGRLVDVAHVAADAAEPQQPALRWPAS